MLQRRRRGQAFTPPFLPPRPFPFLSRRDTTTGTPFARGGEALAATFPDHHSRNNNNHRGTRVIGTWRRGSRQGTRLDKTPEARSTIMGGGGEGGESRSEKALEPFLLAEQRKPNARDGGFLETTHVRQTRHRLLSTSARCPFFPSRTTRPRESEQQRRRRRSRGSRLLPRQRLHDTHCTQ